LKAGTELTCFFSLGTWLQGVTILYVKKFRLTSSLLLLCLRQRSSAAAHVFLPCEFALLRSLFTSTLALPVSILCTWAMSICWRCSSSVSISSSFSRASYSLLLSAGQPRHHHHRLLLHFFQTGLVSFLPWRPRRTGKFEVQPHIGTACIAGQTHASLCMNSHV